MLQTHTTDSQPRTSASLLTDFDLHLFNEGTHAHVYRKLGAHLIELDGTPATLFAVWAPNAEEVSVIGEFNGWQPGITGLASRDTSGVWEGFVPGLHQGALYKYALRPRGSQHWLEKADPYGFASELRPKTASIVWDLSTYVREGSPCETAMSSCTSSEPWTKAHRKTLRRRRRR